MLKLLLKHGLYEGSIWRGRRKSYCFLCLVLGGFFHLSFLLSVPRIQASTSSCSVCPELCGSFSGWHSEIKSWVPERWQKKKVRCKWKLNVWELFGLEWDEVWFVQWGLPGRCCSNLAADSLLHFKLPVPSDYVSMELKNIGGEKTYNSVKARE